MNVDHDVVPGKLDRCQITGSTNLFEVIDLGHQAPCDSMLTEAQLDEPEVTYPLRLMLCPESGLAQLDYIVPAEKMFHREYPYRSGISPPLVAYQHAFAKHTIEKLGVAPGSFCVDVGSNDGTLLAGFVRQGMRVLGVEPTDVGKIARVENNIPTLQRFFTEATAREITEWHPRAKIVTATNVFAHMPDLGEVCRGIEALLADDGVFITESHYLLDVLEGNQFDTILHEHIRTYSLRSLVLLFPRYGLEVFDVERGDRYGGNIRAYVGRAGKRPIAAAVEDLLEAEEAAGLFDEGAWRGFRQRVERNRDRFMAFAWRAKEDGLTIAGQGCPGRCVPLLNYYGVTSGLMPFIAELPGSLKIGLHVPGCHIPVLGSEAMIKAQPDYVLINAWHYAAAAAARLREEGVRSKLMVALPDFRVLDA